jgi:ATP-binding cassette subfamily F protein uup
MLEPADVLLLDEPTNDLDIPSLEVLEESLESFAGAVVLVTHDRYLLDRLSTDLIALDGKGGANAYADLSQWEAAQGKQGDASGGKPGAKPAAPAERADNTKKPPPGLRRLTYMEQREWEQIEAKIVEAEEVLHAAQKEMDDPKVLADRNKLDAVCRRVESAQVNVQKLYARWEELETKQKD